MSDQQGNGAAPPVDMTGDDAARTMMDSLKVCAQKAAGVESAAEADDFAGAALKLAQAIITLDPTRLEGGDTPEARKAAVPPRPAVRDGDKDGRIGS